MKSFEVSDITEIEDLFDFRLKEGDQQLGTATFCSTTGCNNENIPIFEKGMCREILFHFVLFFLQLL